MTKFRKGNIPHNKGKKLEDYFNPQAIDKVKKTQFKSGGENTADKHPSWKGGIQKPKKDCVHIFMGTNKRKRRPRLIYESFYGDIPKGYVIYHKDGNHHNDNIDNLEAISRAELIKRNKSKNENQ